MDLKCKSLKKTFYIFLFLFIPLLNTGQNIDSLRGLLKQNLDDSTRIKVLFDLTEQLYLENPDSALKYCYQIYSIANKNRDTQVLAEIYGWLGYLYMELGKIDSALFFNRKAVKLLKQLKKYSSLANAYLNIASIYSDMGDRKKELEYLNKSLKYHLKNRDTLGIAVVYNNLAYMFYTIGDLGKAIDFWTKALKLQIKIHDYKGIATVYNNLAGVYLLQNDYDQALKNYFKSLQYYKKINDNIGLATVYKGIGGVYSEKAEFDSAKYFYNKSMEIARKINNPQLQADLLLDLSLMHQKTGKYNKAITEAQKALSIYNEIKDIAGTISSYIQLGNLYYEQKNYSKALSFAQKAYNLSQRHNFLELKMQAAELLRKIYLKLNNYKLAYKFYEQQIHARDSLVNQQNYQKLLKEQTKFEIRLKTAIDSAEFSKQMKIKNLQLQQFYAQIKAKRKLQTFLAIGLIITLGLLVLVFYNLRQRNKALKMLQYQNKAMNDILKAMEKQNEVIERQNRELKKYYTIIEQSPIAIVVTDTKARIEYVNPFFTRLTGYTREEAIGKNPRILNSGLTPKETFEDLWKTILKGEIWHGILYNKRKDGSIFIEDTIIAPIKDDNGQIINFVAIKKDITKEVELQNKLKNEQQKLKELYKSVTDSILYAKRIQEALLPGEEFFRQNFKDFFILYKPLNVVSGDFYWARKYNDCVIVALGDATGHGVPGAFLSLLGISLLNEIYRHEDVTKPSEMLEMLRKGIKSALSQKGHIDESENRDGIDIAIFVLNTKTYRLQYAGANRPMYVIRDGELIELKPDRQPASIYLVERPFTNHEIIVGPDDVIYLFSDGYTDQFGTEDPKKFSVYRFKELLGKIYSMPMEEQKRILEEIFEDWKGDFEQLDDVLVLGFRIA